MAVTAPARPASELPDDDEASVDCPDVLAPVLAPVIPDIAPVDEDPEVGIVLLASLDGLTLASGLPVACVPEPAPPELPPELPAPAPAAPELVAPEPAPPELAPVEAFEDDGLPLPLRGEAH